MGMQEISKALIEGEEEQIVQLVQEELEKGIDPQAIIKEGLVPGMDEVGRRFKNYEYFVPEVLLSARAMQDAMDILKPIIIKDANPEEQIKAVFGTSKGDLHDIGKNLIIMMLEVNGYKIIDLGVDVTPEKFLETVKAEKPAIVGMSSMLTTSMMSMRDTIEYFKENGERNSTKFVIGGAPVTAAFAEIIGADGYGENADEAITLIKKLTGRCA